MTTTSVRTPRQIRLLTALLLFGTFMFGMVAGVGLAKWIHSPVRHHPPTPFLPGPASALKLTPAQEAKAHEISERYRPQLEAILREGFPKVKAINEKMENELREILSPEQRKTLDEMKAHRPPMPGGPMHDHGMLPGLMGPGGPPPGGPGAPAGPPGQEPPPWPGAAPPPPGSPPFPAPNPAP